MPLTPCIAQVRRALKEHGWTGTGFLTGQPQDLVSPLDSKGQQGMRKKEVKRASISNSSLAAHAKRTCVNVRSISGILISTCNAKLPSMFSIIGLKAGHAKETI